MKQQCPACGTINPTLNAFCVYCGNSLRPTGANFGVGPGPGPLVTSQPTPPPVVAPKGGRGLVFVLVGMVAVLVVTLAAVVLIALSNGLKLPAGNTAVAVADTIAPITPTFSGQPASPTHKSGANSPIPDTVNVPNIALPATTAPAVDTPTPPPTSTPTPTNTPTPPPTSTPMPTNTPTPTPTSTPRPVSNANRIAFSQPDDNNHWNIYTINFDGTGLGTLIHRDQDVISPAFAPDGQRIVYVLDYEKERRQLRIVNTDGSGDRALTDDATRNEYPVWVDNQTILFVSYRNYPAGSGKSDVLELNVNNGNEALVVPLAGYPSKVGDLTTFTRFTGTYQQVFGMDSSGTRVLEGFNSDFDFGMISPDGQRIVASQNYSKLYILDRNGNKEQLTPDNEIAKDPVWSPDGRYIAYLIRGVTTSIWEINIIDVNTRQTRRLYNNGKLKSYLAWGR